MVTRAQLRSRRRERAQNAIDRQQSGQGTQYDFNTNQAPAFFWMGGLQQDKFATQLFQTDWAARKIVEIPVQDMLRDGWGYSGVDEAQQDQLNEANERLKTLDVLRQVLRIERLVGGGVIYLGVQDGSESPEVPLNIAALRKGALRFLNVLPRSRIARVDWNTDPLSEGYGRPEFFHVNGHRVHRSRFIIFDGDPLLPMPDYTIQANGLERNDGFGMSVLLCVYDDLTRATGSRQAAYQLLQRASVFLASMDLEGLGGSTQGEEAITAMRNLVNQINIYRGGVVHKDPGDTANPISTIAAQFGSVPELLMSYLQVLSAASDIPATRFLGQAPGGLNATGEGDLENYYGRLESERTQRLKPKLLLLQKLVAITVFGSVPDGFGVTFEELWSLSELEQAQVRSQNIDNVTKLLDAFLMTDEEAVDELNALEVTTVTLSGEAVDDKPEPVDPNAPLLDPTSAAQQLLQ